MLAKTLAFRHFLGETSRSVRPIDKPKPNIKATAIDCKYSHSRRSTSVLNALTARGQNNASPVACQAIVKEATANDVWRELEATKSGAGVRKEALVVMFTGEWCGPCALVSKELYKVNMVQDKKVTVLTWHAVHCHMHT